SVTKGESVELSVDQLNDFAAPKGDVADKAYEEMTVDDIEFLPVKKPDDDIEQSDIVGTTGTAVKKNSDFKTGAGAIDDWNRRKEEAEDRAAEDIRRARKANNQ
ncbi:MAG: hypothetical protein KGL39_33320, partial [Patescibacteria group bacterium]|nr:hypothetical protein [Patescibacteria group bacterium]